MTPFTAKEIFDAANLLRPTPNDFRKIVTGTMMGLNMAANEETLPEMVNVATALVMAMQGDKTA